jgi:hypothetical protein
VTPEALVQAQLDAYNARDLARFLGFYADDIRIYRPATSPEPTMSGIAALSEFYANNRFNLPGLHAELVNRIAIGNTVIDHERVSGVKPEPFQVAAVYNVVDDKIRAVWFFD